MAQILSRLRSRIERDLSGPVDPRTIQEAVSESKQPEDHRSNFWTVCSVALVVVTMVSRGPGTVRAGFSVLIERSEQNRSLPYDTVPATAVGGIGPSSSIRKPANPKSKILNLPAEKMIIDGLRSW